ncbi:MAG: MOSC domain-containing protein [Proteobacteria bacterium]|nr:MOSC domain-containing protein [Pseudomonadota bacterium]
MTPFVATIDQIFVGDLRPLEPEGQISGIFKRPVRGAVQLTVEGLAGDHQGDRRHHGGAQKALHHFPAEHYAAFVRRWPQLGDLLCPGTLGENLSTHGMTERQVCIGDIFGFGTARIQVSQPRQPCWKISHRLGVEEASLFVAQQGLTGWYYRVLDAGTVQAGDVLELLERPAPELSLARYWQVINAHRPNAELLRQIAAAPGLAPDKAARLNERADWLQADGGNSTR